MGLAEGFALVALALDAVKEHAGSQEGHQNVAGAVTTQEAVDKGVIHGGVPGVPMGLTAPLTTRMNRMMVIMGVRILPTLSSAVPRSLANRNAITK